MWRLLLRLLAAPVVFLLLHLWWMLLLFQLGWGSVSYFPPEWTLEFVLDDRRTSK
jgi:hypothetical protein